MLCADGVNGWKELGKSSFLIIVMAIWNLPAHIRMKRDNLVLLGMTDKKPKDAHLVYDLVVDQFLELWAGVACWDSVRDEHFKLRAMMAAGLFDYPGLTEASGQPNEGSISGCVKCTLQGVYIKELKHTKYCQHLHDMKRNHDIPVERHTHEGLIARAFEIEVRITCLCQFWDEIMRQLRLAVVNSRESQLTVVIGNYCLIRTPFYVPSVGVEDGCNRY